MGKCKIAFFVRIRNTCCIVIQKTTELSCKSFENLPLSFAISQYLSIFEQNLPPDRKNRKTNKN